MRITIAGSGAIGSLFATYLSEGGHDIHLWTRGNATQIQRKRDENTQIGFASNSPDRLAESDAVFVAVKAFHVEEVLTELAQYLHPDSPVILTHNGMGTDELAARILPNNPLLFATTTHGSLRLSDSHIRHTGKGQTLVGGLNDSGKRCEFLAEVIHHSLPPCTWSDNVYLALWQKLAINCVINPLTAVHKIKNGELLNKKFSEVISSLSEEITNVMLADGMDSDCDIIRQNALQVAKDTAENYSSMNRDLHFKRRSEVDFITGYLISRANIHGIDVPANLSLWQQIKNLEQSYEK
ncbi:2-dehydropantoate 2-reductase [Veronia nyctiphanis]|uniref:2-dehydropantoate 2-reductase n=1 Tax=Veronia nyctiphanis TaxID=1278244 RepID=A0A4Q0YR88_9GAMM|nr:2-dehydropantoate 2-reductase [Veronia nyctiphanis]RXJ73103.1 2-dehydropantoate 2-reductase [Veronia nyctiphanis]